MHSATETKTCKLTLDITLATKIPDGDELFITGNLPELGNWDPTGLQLSPQNKDHYQIDLKAETGSIIECKITRGSWKTQGIYDPDDIPPSNLVIKVDTDEIIPVTIVDWLDAQVKESDPVQGKLLTFNHLVARGLRYQRPIQVWLPENTDPQAVIYMHDGQNLFEPAAAFAGVDWKVDEVLTDLIRQKKIPSCMVVGIPNSPNRMQELNLFTDAGKAYADFIIEEVKPFIEENFGMSSSPDKSSIMGSSMGGLMSFQMAYFIPGVFGGAGCLSSAFGRAEPQISQALSDFAFVPNRLKIYLDTGEYEPPIAKSYFKMMKLLKEKGFIEGLNLMGYFDEKATHCEAAWAKRLALPLEFLLKTQNK